VAERRSQICLGLDPDPEAIAAESAPRRGGDPAGAAAAAVAVRCRELIAAASPACVAAKLQLACFERLGVAGWTALEEVRDSAREHGLLVIADGKRGDVPVTAEAYAQALVGETRTPWGPVPGLGVDAFTANPLLGRDALAPLVAAAARAGAAVFMLVRTTNPGAAELQDAPDASPLHQRLAGLVDGFADELAGSDQLSGAGAVVGATAPELIGRLRELMPRAIFLMPGVGAQGGRPQDLGSAFGAGPGSALVTASRGISSDSDPGAAAERLRAEVWEVSGG
jgi:orotidine-5'-phosphate decarboxylase